ncbi:MAG: DUF192 domain-containing protein [Myxococcota bacterium]|nr:DUF192 domain-containing protein [Myxococcota bacterium]
MWLAWTAACALSGTGTVVDHAVPLEINGHEIQVEVADDPTERQRGLMYRTDLAKDAGMLFVYSGEAQRSFWMENTRIPLSIAYVDQAGRIVHIADMVPFDRTAVPSKYPAMYAIELNRGRFTELGVSVGDQVLGLPGPSKD